MARSRIMKVLLSKPGMASIMLLVAISLPLLILFGDGPRRLDLILVTPLYYGSLIYAAIWHYRNVCQYGKQMTLDEIFLEKDPKRIAQLLRYHHEWSDTKIVSVLNERKLYYNKRWTEAMVASCTNTVAKVW